MSIQFGQYQVDGHDVELRRLTELSRATCHWAPDGTFVHAKGQIGMGLQPFHTHSRSKLDAPVEIDESGNMLTLDGRIDNHAEICEELSIFGSEIADSKIVCAAFRRWGPTCFSKLVGDWAIALWSGLEHSLYLARDHAGTRPLYFERTDDGILWSTSLETFFLDKRSRDLDEAYAACYLASQPIRDLTPYRGISGVTPAHYLVFKNHGITRQQHWNWMVKEKIFLPSDVEYEERFLSLFRQSVERRTGPGAPILAQLSGGMDSTSIVCMSDRIRKMEGTTTAGLLDTVSFFDDPEPNWDERPYFSVVGAARGKSGIHLGVSAENRTFELADLPAEIVGYLPGLDRYAIERERFFEDSVGRGNFRVILSGIGGDELLGGVPTPYPELADLFVSGRIGGLASKAVQFCLPNRTPILHMLGKTFVYAANSYFSPTSDRRKAPPWIARRIKQRATKLERTRSAGSARFGFLPSRIENGTTWWLMLETLPHLYPSVLSHYEYRYPYLDRDLVDFLFRIPREQLLRPGRRRSLMRRALAGFVPTAVLERRRKASLIRGPLISLRRAEQTIRRIFDASLTDTMGLIDAECFKDILAVIVQGTTPKWWPAVTKTISFELWLQEQRAILNGVPTPPPESVLCAAKAAQKSSARATPLFDVDRGEICSRRS